MKKLRYELPKQSVKKDYLFNIFGSTTNAAVSVILLVVVSHMVGEAQAGIFSLCFTTAQMMYTLATFEMRNIQVTDVKNEFSFSDFIAFRVLTILLMLISSVIFVFINGFQGTKATLTLLLCLYMAMLSISDVLQGNMHRNNYLSLAGISLGCTSLLAAVSFTIFLATTQSLICSVIPMAIVVALWIMLYDIPFSGNFSEIRPCFRLINLKRLFFETLPLFISVFITQFAFNAPKYAINDYLTEVDQSHYGFLVMPAFFINLLSLFVFRPQLVSLSEKWANKDYTGFGKTVKWLYIWIFIFAIVTMAVGFVIGIPVLNLLYNTSLNAYRNLFMILLLSGGFGAGSTLSVTMLAVIRKQKNSVIAYVVTAVLAMFIPNILVRKFGFAGAVYAYFVEMLLLFSLLFLIFIVCYRKGKLSSLRRKKQ